MSPKADDRSIHDKAKVKIRFLEVDLEGANQTLVESVRNFTQAIARGAAPPTKPLPLKPARPLTGSAESRPQQLDLGVDGASDAVEDADEVIDVAPPEQEAEREAVPRPRRERKPTTYEPIEVDCKSDVSLKSFCDAMKLEADTEKYLAIATWLKRHRNISEISGGHVLTCLRWMRWKVPSDVTTALRKMKGRNFFKAGSESGTYAITHIGENEFDMMVGQ